MANFQYEQKNIFPLHCGPDSRSTSLLYPDCLSKVYWSTGYFCSDRVVEVHDILHVYGSRLEFPSEI